MRKEKSNLRDKGFIMAPSTRTQYVMVLTVQGHSISWWGSQGSRSLKQLFTSHPQSGSREKWIFVGFLSPLHSPETSQETQPQWVGLFILVSTMKVIPCRPTHGSIPQVIPDSVRLAFNINSCSHCVPDSIHGLWVYEGSVETEVVLKQPEDLQEF